MDNGPIYGILDDDDDALFTAEGCNYAEEILPGRWMCVWEPERKPYSENHEERSNDFSK